mmetsp:Transcript_17771/g.36551  ORF Transcript_17771/g.36551 Transcript_17771/m.36551 type:complete len:177 (-) Transcript_17771:540-1070(-)|eukprot:CAMPEP_0201175380 /NCGR_PEP_ID=MMETSP0851-20130426/101503_1 /ASSEMBLY_ACC=CAM_ASM_000631 /TAXON_ID=183588 /ORGANISM="Pseudo-nitzschia fraudulenta, Strain WWA7" /LENGTH=176 /DNA_ID=CAMNT_0047458527 /DNA_START=111 /DNA_END=641 /DNA_ORIENTATION=-
MTKLASSRMLIGAMLLLSADGFSVFQTESASAKSFDPMSDQCPPTPAINDIADSMVQSRRDSFASIMSAVTVGAAVLSSPAPALAAADCMKDCVKNCLIIAPKDKEYCTDSCTAYCAQDDRTDGLSGSVSAENGEVGILGGSFGQGTVPKGEDKPPSIKIPGLDFSSGSGKKLIGY